MAALRHAFRSGALCAIACAIAAEAHAQVLIVEPACGVAGQTTVSIRGSGWAEPNPPCHYEFYFDGAVVAPPQPDGLNGPPMASFVVPANAQPGDHYVRVELRIDENNSLIQCRKIKFKVVAQERDPFAGQLPPPTNGAVRPTVYIGFNPHDVCDVTPCDAIQLIQVVRIEGITATESRTLTPSEVGVRNGSSLDPNVTSSGHMVDNPGAQGTDPYYTGPRVDPGDEFGSPGQQGDLPLPASMHDSPWLEDFPPDVTKIVLHFEVNAFCAAGTNRGEWLGQVRWRWERMPGQSATITVLGADRSPPSTSFMEALDRWNANKNNRMPPPKPPTLGGEPC